MTRRERLVRVRKISPVINRLRATYSPGSNLQKFIDMEAIRITDPFVPVDTTALKKSPMVKTEFGSGQIIYEIYGNPHGRNSWNDTTSRFQGGIHAGGKRGSYWVQRAMNEGGRERLMLGINRFIERNK